MGWRTPVFALVAVVACGSTSPGPCTLTQVGASCVHDTDCCSGWCQLYDTAAYCQAKPALAPACIDANGFCTQNRNCCSGLCENGACFAGAPTGQCLQVGSTCIQDDSCCTNNCVNDGQGHQACAAPDVGDGGPACGFPGDPCSMPGQDDPTECCFGLCGIASVCMGSGGGGGSGCGKSGAYCLYGTDCCSGLCEQVSSGSACH